MLGSLLLAVDDVRGARRLIDRAEVIVKTCETPYLRGMLLLADAIYTINLHAGARRLHCSIKRRRFGSSIATVVDWSSTGAAFLPGR